MILTYSETDTSYLNLVRSQRVWIKKRHGQGPTAVQLRSISRDVAGRDRAICFLFVQGSPSQACKMNGNNHPIKGQLSEKRDILANREEQNDTRNMIPHIRSNQKGRVVKCKPGSNRPEAEPLS